MEGRGTQLETGELLAGYRIEGLISRGGMGSVYRARNVALNRVYALKVLPEQLASDWEFRERFRREMRIAASLDHPNIVAVHNAGEQDGLLFFVMDFISGTDLRALLRQSGAMAPERASYVMSQIASALDAAHAHGLVHRDVKPANILISVRDAEERAWLTDFGLARRLDSASSIEALTKTGTVVGTVHYMSPEQITGERVDARADIYALGCVFFQMLTGSVPYDRETSLATLYAHVHEPPPALVGRVAERYPAFDGVLARAMATQPDDRYSSAGDFARDAAAALRGVRYTGPETIVGKGEAAPSRAGESAPRYAGEAAAQHTAASLAPVEAPPRGHGLRRYRWAAVATVLLCAGIAAVIAFTSSGSSPVRPAASFNGLLQPVPANRVTGSGSAMVQISGDIATVTVETNDLIAAPHLMHIHGGTGRCPAASVARPYNGHLAVGAAEGNAVYGGIVTSLTEHGSTSPAVDLAASQYPAVGNIRYRRTVRLAPGVASTIKAGLAVIVVHGIDYDSSGRYDNVLGSDPRFGGLPVDETAPALCGPLILAQTASAGQHLPDAVYAAALRLYGGAIAPPLLCHLPPVSVTGVPASSASRSRAA
ncbi:MAG: serine/threonine protein kinase [Solirubrobacterales bacterium]|nr:serine/threonine protein kinase [Solirubrobacterales bacterium]